MGQKEQGAVSGSWEKGLITQTSWRKAEEEKAEFTLSLWAVKTLPTRVAASSSCHASAQKHSIAPHYQQEKNPRSLGLGLKPSIPPGSACLSSLTPHTLQVPATGGSCSTLLFIHFHAPYCSWSEMLFPVLCLRAPIDPLKPNS